MPDAGTFSLLVSGAQASPARVSRFPVLKVKWAFNLGGLIKFLSCQDEGDVETLPVGLMQWRFWVRTALDVASCKLDTSR